MTDYKAIADADVALAEPDLETAYNTLAAQTVTTNPELMLTYIGISNRVGFTIASKLSARVVATMDAWVHEALQNEGIDINNAQTPVLLDSMVDATFTQADADAIKAAGNIDVPVFPNLKLGHLQNAREMRARGEI